MTPLPRVAITRPLTIDPGTILDEKACCFDVLDVEDGARADALPRFVSGATALVPMPNDRVDDALLVAAGPALRLVANHAVGLDNVDLAACHARGVLVTNTPGVLTEATADLTLALLLAFARRVREGESVVRRGGWAWSPTMLLGMELAGKRLGIFGLGRIGRAVARRAGAFGMEVVATGRPDGRGGTPDDGIARVSFDELLAKSDVVSIHAPLTPETRHKFDTHALRAMKRDALLINTARGPIVDEEALVHVLQSGHLAGAALDVYEHEPQVHPGLLTLENVVLLPHLGSATRETRRRMAELALGNVAAVLAGRAPLTKVG